MTILFWVLVGLVGILGGICLGQRCIMENNKMLKNENSKLKGKLSDVKSQLRTVEKVRSEWFNEWIKERKLSLSLKGDLAAVCEANSDLANVSADLRGENKDLKSQVAFNRSEAERFRSDRAEWFGKYVALLKEHKTLEKCLEIKDAHIDSLNLMKGIDDDQVMMLNSENEVLKTRLTSAQADSHYWHCEFRDAKIGLNNMRDKFILLEHECEHLKSVNNSNRGLNVGPPLFVQNHFTPKSVPEHGQYDPERNSIDY